jgi:hypothetical protein
MRTKVLTLALVCALAFSSLAMAGELSSSDSNFLFGKSQAAATTIPAQEMQNTQGKQLLSGSFLGSLLGQLGLQELLGQLLGQLGVSNL